MDLSRTAVSLEDHLSDIHRVERERIQELSAAWLSEVFDPNFL